MSCSGIARAWKRGDENGREQKNRKIDQKIDQKNRPEKNKIDYINKVHIWVIIIDVFPYDIDIIDTDILTIST